MCDKELLVSYLYEDELDAAERKALQQHLASCRDCREEAQALRATRTHLAAWQVPPATPPLQSVLTAAVPRPRFGIRPGWWMGAAAALVLAAASAIANLEVRTIDGGLVIRTGWGQAAPDADTAGVTPGASREELLQVQQRVRELERALAARSVPAIAQVSHTADGLSQAEMLRRVRRLIDESETRQEQALAARLMQGMREMQAAHSTDLLRLERTTNQFQGAYNDEILRLREETKQLYRLVSSTQLQR